VRRSLGIRTATGSGAFQQAELTAGDAAAGDQFGTAVALSVTSSGTTVVVGAQGKDSGTGAAYVFTRSGATWSQQAELTAGDAAAGDDFGTAYRQE
jgi:hypothetical protein